MNRPTLAPDRSPSNHHRPATHPGAWAEEVLNEMSTLHMQPRQGAVPDGVTVHVAAPSGPTGQADPLSTRPPPQPPCAIGPATAGAALSGLQRTNPIKPGTVQPVAMSVTVRVKQNFPRGLPPLCPTR